MYNEFFGLDCYCEGYIDKIKFVGIMISYEEISIIFLVEVNVLVLLGLMVVVFVFMWNCCRV